MTLSPNTPITQENAALLKAGDVFKHVAADVFRTLRSTSGEWPDLWLHFEEDRYSAVLCDRFVFHDRPALAKPAERACLGWLSTGHIAPTPPSVDWERVGPKLVEALEDAVALLWEHVPGIEPRITPLDAALAAAQPEGK